MLPFTNLSRLQTALQFQSHTRYQSLRNAQVSALSVALESGPLARRSLFDSVTQRHSLEQSKVASCRSMGASTSWQRYTWPTALEITSSLLSSPPPQFRGSDLERFADLCAIQKNPQIPRSALECPAWTTGKLLEQNLVSSMKTAASDSDHHLCRQTDIMRLHGSALLSITSHARVMSHSD